MARVPCPELNRDLAAAPPNGRIERLFRAAGAARRAAGPRTGDAAASRSAARGTESHPQCINRGSAASPQRSAGSPPASVRKRRLEPDVVVAAGRIPQHIVVWKLDFPTTGSVDSACSPVAGEPPAIEERQQNGGPDTAARSVKRRSSPDHSQLSPTRVRDVVERNQRQQASSSATPESPRTRVWGAQKPGRPEDGRPGDPDNPATGNRQPATDERSGIGETGDDQQVQRQHPERYSNDASRDPRPRHG